MNALTVSPQHVLAKRPTNCYQPIPSRWRQVLALHLAGKSAEEVAAETGYTANSVYRIINHPNTIQLRQQMLETTQKEFDALFSKVVDVIRKGLEDPDSKTAAIFTNQWLRANGKLSDKQKGLTINLTAEDVVMQIKNGTYQKGQNE
jgi:predicted transcriptional regulator